MSQVKTEGQRMWDFAANPAEETVALYTLLKEQAWDIRELRVLVGELRNRTYTGPLHISCVPQPDSTTDKPLFGYQSDERGGPCDHCGDPASEHPCPNRTLGTYVSPAGTKEVRE